MVFSQWCISCWHLDKCLPSRADLPFRLDQERTRQTAATLVQRVLCNTPQTPVLVRCLTHFEINLDCGRRSAFYLKPTMGHSLQMLHLAWCLAVSAAATLCRTGSQTIDWGSKRIQSTNCLGSSSTLLFTWAQKSLSIMLSYRVNFTSANKNQHTDTTRKYRWFILTLNLVTSMLTVMCLINPLQKAAWPLVFGVKTSPSPPTAVLATQLSE